MDKKQYHKKWYRKNKQKVLDRQKKLKEENPKHFREVRRRAELKYNKTPKGIYNGLKKNRLELVKISQQDFIEWYKLQEKKCTYCSIPEDRLYLLPTKTSYPVKRLTIDRKDNSLPYQRGNIALACFRCNTLKRDFFSFKEMKEIAQKYIKPKWQKLIQKPFSQN